MAGKGPFGLGIWSFPPEPTCVAVKSRFRTQWSDCWKIAACLCHLCLLLYQADHLLPSDLALFVEESEKT